MSPELKAEQQRVDNVALQVLRLGRVVRKFDNPGIPCPEYVWAWRGYELTAYHMEGCWTVYVAFPGPPDAEYYYNPIVSEYVAHKVMKEIAQRSDRPAVSFTLMPY